MLTHSSEALTAEAIMSNREMDMKAQPHALMFPYPSLSHINPMMQLAKRLLQHGFFITFVNTEFNHQHFFKPGSGHPQELHRFPNLRFEQIADGLPPSHMRLNEKSGVTDFIAAILALPGPFAKLVQRIMSRVDDAFPPLTCIIADSFSSWMQGVADQFRIPRVSLWTTPVHANLAYTFQSTLVSHGLIPVTDKSKLAEEVKCIEGIAPMKLEDYVSFFLVDTPTDFLYQWCLRFTMKRPEEALWNLGNNFAEFESEALNAFKKVVPNFLPVGPLLPAEMLSGHGLAPDATTGHTGAMSLLPEDLSCSDWLSQHDTASVIYISFGSIVNMSEEELADFILGLEESGAPFLWAVRPEQGGVALTQLRKQLDAEATEGNRSRRGLIVSWAPQLAVLRHPSVGLFVSAHCGWNSIVESLVAGVPILAKAGGFAEQRMNAYYVEEVWKVGLRLPRRAMAGVVKSQICALLGRSSPLASEVRECVEKARQSALAAVAPSSWGSSSCNLRLFIDDMHKRAAASIATCN